MAQELMTQEPEVLDKLNVDEAVDQYADMLGVPAEMINSDEDVAAVREGRAQQQQAAMAAQMAQQAVDGAKTLSETDMGNGNSALQQITGAPAVP